MTVSEVSKMQKHNLICRFTCEAIKSQNSELKFRDQD